MGDTRLSMPTAIRRRARKAAREQLAHDKVGSRPQALEDLARNHSALTPFQESSTNPEGEYSRD